MNFVKTMHGIYLDGKSYPAKAILPPTQDRAYTCRQ